MKIIVSIIIPTYKRIEFLEETIKSIRSQTIGNWECIVVDDDPNESARELLYNLGQEDDRIKYFARPASVAIGVSSCRNYGFEKSIGKYIQYLDDDDLISENKLEKQIDYLERLDNEYVYATCDWDYYWNNKVYEPKRLKRENIILKNEFFPLLRNNMTFLPIHTYLTPRLLIDLAGPWNSYLLINEDAEFFTRVLLVSKKLVHIDECFVLYRVHDDSRISTRNKPEEIESLIKSFQLMYTHLEKQNLVHIPFFKWKLYKLVLINWKRDRQIFRNNAKFLKMLGIDLKYIQFHRIKYFLYGKLMPVIKKIR